jgi:hypothetical protein
MATSPNYYVSKLSHWMEISMASNAPEPYLWLELHSLRHQKYCRTHCFSDFQSDYRSMSATLPEAVTTTTATCPLATTQIDADFHSKCGLLCPRGL